MNQEILEILKETDAFLEDDCPVCQAGKIALVKPGSRGNA